MAGQTLPSSNGSLELGTSLIPFQSGSGAPFRADLPNVNDAKKVSLVIESVEISTDGENWLLVSAGSATATVGSSFSESGYQSLGIAAGVPPDEYHAIRVRFRQEAPTVLERTIRENGVDPEYRSVPYVRQFNTIGFAGNESLTSEVVASSLNGYLTPFRVETGKTLYLVLGLVFASLSPSETGNYSTNYNWTLYTGVKVTRIRPA